MSANNEVEKLEDQEKHHQHLDVGLFTHCGEYIIVVAVSSLGFPSNDKGLNDSEYQIERLKQGRSHQVHFCPCFSGRFSK